jgi:hypothetical protein
MDQDRLAEIAAESDDSRSHRKTLHSDLEILRKGLVLCRRHKPRPVTCKCLRTCLPFYRDVNNSRLKLANPCHNSLPMLCLRQIVALIKVAVRVLFRFKY